LGLGLALAVCAGVIAYGDHLGLAEIGQTLSSVRDTSLDAAFEAKVRSALALSRRVSGLKFDLEARSGVVTLRGRVPTQEARSIIDAIVTDTPGTVEVRDELVVDPKAAANGYEQTLLQRISDLETHVAVQERLRHEPLLARSNVNVDVERGVVVLRGEVESDLERASAQDLARAAVGADHVRDELRVLGLPKGDLDPLARRVEFELYSASVFDLARIQVTSAGGQITLHGSVRSPAERLLAPRLAESVPGVTAVVNELTVEKS
jgi:osmotically-inducible protein OsmY